MKSVNGRIGVVALSLAAVLTTGCAPMSEARRDEIDYSRADFRNKFIEDRARCRFEGRQLLVIGWGGSLDRDGIPRTRVSYACR